MTAQPAGSTAPDIGPFVHRELQDRIVRLRLNRPRQFNPLSMEMLQALQAALDDAAGDEQVRAIVIAAEGKGFCGGHDLKQMTAHRKDNDGGEAFYRELFAACSRMMLSIVRHPKIIVAEVQGTASAAGCQLVAACDIAVASTNARFGVNGIDSGLFCSTPMVALSRTVGRKAAMELLTTGRFLSAHEAVEAGLVNHAVEPDQLQQKTLEIAGKLAHRSRAVLALGKKAFYEQLEMPLEEAYAHAGNVIVSNMMMDDAIEGIGAFIEKRQPEWKDK